MSAYMIANVDIKDSEKIKEYLKLTPSLVRKFGGKFLVRGGDFWVAEGNWKPKRLVILEFDSFARAKEFWYSEEYAPVKALRQEAAESEVVFVEGLPEDLAASLNSSG